MSAGVQMKLPLAFFAGGSILPERVRLKKRLHVQSACASASRVVKTEEVRIIPPGLPELREVANGKRIAG
jgi:hypothetical protein